MNPLSAHLVRASVSQERDETYYHPSEATQCSLQVWFRKMEARGKLRYSGTSFNASTLLIFQVGHLMHGWVQNALVKDGIIAESNIERPIKDEDYKVTGSIDIYAEAMETDEYEELLPKGPARIVDIKSCSWTSFSTHHYPEFAHIVQTSIYAHYTGLEDITIWYICKDGGKFDNWLAEVGIEKAKKMGVVITDPNDPLKMPIRVVHFKKDQRLVDQSLEKFRSIENHIQNNTYPMPEREPTEKYSDCLSCAFRYHCQELTGRYHPDIPVE